jgi:putative NADPH-quinone reductase
MRVLVLFAHPLADSFHAALHRDVLAALHAAGHTVDDLDLYAEGFDPVLIPTPVDQNSCAQSRNPMDMMRQG